MLELTKDERAMIAKGLTLLRRQIKRDKSPDLKDYNRIEIANCDALAEKMDLDEDYYLKG